jgi:SH3-like domain-containing protein
MKWLSVVTVLLTAISLGILTLAYTEYSKENCSEFAVLMSKSVVIKSAPNEKGDVLFQLHEGTKIRLVDEVGEWRKIKLADGKVGWVQVNHLQRI